MLRGLLMTFCCVAAAVAEAQAQRAPSVQGVWRLIEERVTDAGGTSTSMSGAGLLILTSRHYSFVRVRGSAQRALFAGIAPTPEEKIGAYNTLGAATGNYEIEGAALTVRPIAAKHPNYMAGGFEHYEWRMLADTLWLSNRCSDWHVRVGARVVPDTAQCQSQRRFIRVE